jgi:hypothetical protein
MSAALAADGADDGCLWEAAADGTLTEQHAVLGDRGLEQRPAEVHRLGSGEDAAIAVVLVLLLVHPAADRERVARRLAEQIPSVSELPVEDGLLAPCPVVSLADHTTRH